MDMGKVAAYLITNIMETSLDIDTTEWGLGITFYSNISIHAKFKYCITLQILCAYIQIDFIKRILKK